MLKIGEKIVRLVEGNNVEYEVIGFDGSERPILNTIGIVTSDIVTEEVIEEVKEVLETVEKKETTKAPTKVPTNKKTVKKK